MKGVSWGDLAQAVGGKWLSFSGASYKQPSGGGFEGVSTDTRRADLAHKVFFALKGPRFDGHHFLQQAVDKQAAALVVSQKNAGKSLAQKGELKNLPPVLLVEDTLTALQKLAVYWRQKNKWKVIGITGSVGKTTSKRFCLQLLQPHCLVQASQKSFNNAYGVPLSLLSAPKDLDFFIQEIGMNQKGEMAALAQMVQPDTAVVTQVGSSHIGLLKTRLNIAYEKQQIYQYVQPGGVFVFNKDDSYARWMYNQLPSSGRRARGFVFFSAKDSSADVFLQVREVSSSALVVGGHITGFPGEVRVRIAGAEHAVNIRAAAALALAAGLKPFQIWEGFSRLSLPPGRNQWVALKSGAQALFDAYNASLESAEGLLNHFLSPFLKQKKILILGDFLELGEYTQEVFAALARRLSLFQQSAPWQQNLYAVWFIGSQAELFGQALQREGWGRIVWPDQERSSAQGGKAGGPPLYLSKKIDTKLAKKICSVLDPSFVLAFKASRKMRMETVLSLFKPVDFHAL